MNENRSLTVIELRELLRGLTPCDVETMSRYCAEQQIKLPPMPTLLGMLLELEGAGVLKMQEEGVWSFVAANTPAEVPELLPTMAETGPALPELSQREISTELAVLRRMDLGFELMPYNAETTVTRVRELHRSMLTAWLETGAYLYRAKLVMGNRFWPWFDEQQLPFGRKWASQSMQTLRMVLHDPELPKLVKKMQSIKAFRVVASRLALPEGKAEYQTTGTILGRTPEELGQMSERAVLGLAKPSPQLELLPDNAVRKERDELASSLMEREAELMAERMKTSNLMTELMVARQQIARNADPELNSAGITGDFLRDLHSTRQLVMAKLSELRPSRRRDLDGLSESAVLELYSTLLLLEKAVNLNMREVETRFAGRVPELLQDSDGQPRAPMSRANLRVLEEELQETWQGVSAMADGKAVTVIDGRTGEIVGKSECFHHA